ncbi:hypothetical protein DS2_18513 [Catenovulum agarivorans DS-2]|uniref:Uncharacterized protein n=1 Tax=Catenovulum agarivorans DS-2 TaxID=1328313 RepID=W7QJ98_9ALTE|nr:hypothetical protein [Catenovulum agarivorans]EWH08213.1 hypothetical protein DS2_18513 [Catenovulum agarivorans DS-2]
MDLRRGIRFQIDKLPDESLQVTSSQGFRLLTKLKQILRVKYALTPWLLLSLSLNHAATSNVFADEALANNTTMPNKTAMADKVYRQAQYLQQVGEVSNAVVLLEKFSHKQLKHDQLLAELYLQLNMPWQAQSSIQQYQFVQTDSRSKTQALLADVFLDLTQVALSQKDLTSAKFYLEQINQPQQLSNSQQALYLNLAQVIYWPNMGSDNEQLAELIVANNVKADKENINLADLTNQLNQVVYQYQQQNYQQAATKITVWFARVKDFKLDGSEQNSSLQTSPRKTFENLIAYATIIRSQISFAQGQFKQAKQQLASFARDNAFSQHALYLYALTLMQMGELAASEAALNLHKQEFGISHYYWFNMPLLAQKWQQQQEYVRAFNVYQQLEAEINQALKQLPNSQQQMLVADFSQASLTNSVAKQDIWQGLAMQNNQVAGAIQLVNQVSQLDELLAALKLKIEWFDYLLEVQQKRFTRIADSVQQAELQQQISQLTDKLTVFNQQLVVVDNIGTNTADSNLQQTPLELLNQLNKTLDPQQAKWLADFNLSQQIIDSLPNEKTDENKDAKKKARYQQRLDKVAAVLYWQVNQQLPERSWQYKKALSQIEKTLAELNQQQQRLQRLTSEQFKLNQYKSDFAQIQQSYQQIVQLTKLSKQQVTQQYQTEVKAFYQQQHSMLEKALLTTQQAIAHLLENLPERAELKEQADPIELGPAGSVNDV